MTDDQKKYLTYLVALRDFKETYKKLIMGFEFKGELDWKTYEQWKDEVVASFPEEGVQIGRYKATLHQKNPKPTFQSQGVYELLGKKSIVLHKFKKGEPK